MKEQGFNNLELRMNKATNTYRCPICKTRHKLENLCYDGKYIYFCVFCAGLKEEKL